MTERSPIPTISIPRRKAHAVSAGPVDGISLYANVFEGEETGNETLGVIDIAPVGFGTTVAVTEVGFRKTLEILSFTRVNRRFPERTIIIKKMIPKNNKIILLDVIFSKSWPIIYYRTLNVKFSH